MTNTKNQIVYSYEDLREMFPFGKNKFNELCRSRVLPVIKVGRTYISTPELVSKWFEENAGREVV